MRHILFVDEEAHVLAGLRTMLRRYRHEWQMTFVGSEAEAQQILGSQPVDVLVTELGRGARRPDLLDFATGACPGVVRILLTGTPELQASLHGMEKAHRFLTKPCDPEVLRHAVERACALHDLLDNPALREIAGAMGSLPSLPSTYAELVAAIADPDTSVRDVAGIVERDAAMCAQIFHLVNSAYFGVVRRITSIQQAVTFLGTRMLKNLVLSVEVFRAFEGARRIPGFSLERLQEHATLSARIASRLVPRADADDAFMAAMLHDLGVLMMAARLPEQLALVLDTARAEDRDVVDVERALLGTTHAELGAYLLGLWGLPGPLVDAVAHHHHPSQVASRDLDLLAATHLADALSAELRNPHRARHATVDEGWLEANGWLQELDGWRAMAAEVAAGEGG